MKLHAFNYSFKNQSDDTLDIYIDGYIVDAATQQFMKEWYGDDTTVSYKSLRNQVEKSKATTINVYINSGGGIVTDAMAMHDMLIDLQSKGITVNTHVRGIAASAATYIAMAGNNTSISENSWLMIHNVQGGVWGDVNEIENYARTIRKFNDSANQFYQNKTGLSKTVIANMMDQETWLTAEESKEKGFIKNITCKEDFTNAIQPEHWPFSNRTVLNAYNSFTQKSDTMDLTKMKDALKNVLAELGFSKEPNEEKLTNAVDKITNAISENLKPADNQEDIKTLIINAVTDALKEVTPEKIAETVKNQVTAATKDLVTTEDFTNLKNSIAEKLGGISEEKPPKEDRKVANKKSFFDVGEFEKN